MHVRRVLICVLLVWAGCGDNLHPEVDSDADALPGDFPEELRAAPEIATVTEHSTAFPGYRYFRIQFDQPVDHDHPEGERFQQYVSLIHYDAAAPMVMVHTGYGNWYHDNPHQLTWLLRTNQIVVEHRFFRTSRPAGGAEIWPFLTIRQSAADHHRITQALRRIYRGKWLETGASKGGMTSIYHRRFYPDDIDGTVAYVAPISFGAPDNRYDAQLETIGPPECRQALRDVQVELLRNRRTMLESRTQQQATLSGYVYRRVALLPAIESAVIALEWSFWQYLGAGGCDDVPAVNATDGVLWDFLDRVSPVSSSSDAKLSEFEAYYYQADEELGYPGTIDQHLEGLPVFTLEDFAGAYPEEVPRPRYQPEAMIDIDTWVRTEGERLIFLYGEWDPWSGGMFNVGEARDSMRVIASQQPHGADINDLSSGDRVRVYAALEAWTGVTPDPDRLFRRAWVGQPPPLPRIPPAILRAMQLKRR